MIYRDLQYADTGSRPLLLDLYLPAAPEPCVPTVVWITAGGWRKGDRRAVRGEFLAEQGYAMASIDYRPSGEAIWPAQIHDCKAAIRWLRANAQRYGLDSHCIGAWGASAGGLLVAMLAVTGDLPQLEGDVGHRHQSSAIAAACDWCGPTDLTRLREPSWRVPRTDNMCQIAAELLGGPLEHHNTQALEASPITYVNAKCPPIFIMHGLVDDIVSPEHSKVFHTALRNHGVDSTLDLLEGQGHSFYTDERADRVRAFFDRTLKPTRR